MTDMNIMARRKRSNAVCSNAMARRKRIKLCNALPSVLNQGADVVRADVVRVILVCCKVTGRVLFLEAGDNFVEILLSFLALPVGSVVKLLSKEGVEGGLNCISNILDSLETFSDLLLYVDKLALTDLEPSSTEYSKPEDLLQLVPSNVCAVKDFVLYECGGNCTRVSTSYGARCPCNANNGSFSKLSILTLALSPEQDLKPVVMSLYECGAHCNRVSANFGARCPCNSSNGYFFDLSLLTLIESPEQDSKMVDDKVTPKTGSLKNHIRYVVTDSLEISPNSITKSISILSKAKVKKISALTSMEVPVTPRQILQLLKAALTSNTALSNVFGSQITIRDSPAEDPPLRSLSGLSRRLWENSLRELNT